MKRIVIITDTWEPQKNGVVTTLRHLIPELQSRRIEVSIIEPSRFFTLPLPRYPEIRLAISSKRRMRTLLREARPDAIHIETEGPLGLLARRACDAENLRFTASYHTHFPQYVRIYAGKLFGACIHAYIRWFHKTAAATVVSTEPLRRTLLKDGFTNVVIRPLGVDAKLFTRRTCPLSKEEAPHPRFVCLNRLAPEKNVEEFLQLKLPGSKILIGDGPLRKALEKKYGNATTFFLGYRTGERLVEALSCADVLVFPSRTDTFGLNIIEALACGIPVAAHDVMGPRDILSPGIDGELSENLEEAALRALKLIPNAKQCREKALRYSWKNSADAFLKNLRPVRQDSI